MDNNRRKLSFLGFNPSRSDNADPDEVQLDAEMEKVFAGSEKDTLPFSDRKASVGKLPEVIAYNNALPVVQDGGDPLVSERAMKKDNLDDDDEDKKQVKFIKPGEEAKSPKEEDEDHRRRKTRTQHYKQRKHSLGDAPGSRKTSTADGTTRKISVQPEDADLQQADIDDLTSHRSDDPRGMRRPRVQASTQPSRNNSMLSPGGLSEKKTIDHSPHEVFVQLDELVGTGEECEWKETARWIKYEEDVEEGSDRWGRPHVASLSFHSLLNLRRCLETGVVLLDLDEKDLPGVAYRVVEQMVVEDLLQEEDKSTVMRALLLRHRHVNESGGGFHFHRRKFSSYTSLQNLSGEDKKPKIVPSSEINGHGGDTRIDMKEETYSSSQEDLVKKAQHDSILKRIPIGAEATTVLVGAVDFLTQPTIAFIRLAEGITMPNITEVPIPVRFLFILLGPKNIELDYHEVGRSIATLMSNHHFHEIAYKADDRKDLLSAINEFLDDSIVLPPGNWERQELLPIEELKAKSDRIRNRKAKALMTKNKDKQIIADEEKRLLAAADGGDGGKDGDGGGKKPKGPLEKTGRPWGGLVNDVKRRWPMFKSDIMDGLNSETLAASLFMYFAALSTAITFGGLASDKTFNLIGISETLISACVVGVIFHALSGQPLTIIGTTGPLLLFDEALYQFCLSNGYSFLTVRVYVGIWMSVIALTVSAFEGSVYVRLFTRFTQEIFSALITLIYLVETAMKLGSIYKRHPLHASYVYKEVEPSVLTTAALVSSGNATEPSLINSLISEVATVATNLMEVAENSSLIASADNTATDLLVPFDNVGKLNQPNTALFCTFLTLGTFALAYYLKIFRNSHFLGRTARRALGDFGVPIAIALFVALDYINPQVYTDKLSVPDGISPSDPEARGWLIPLGPVPIWLPFVCVIPAMLVYILAFMETHISELIVDKPERGLKKGSGLHLDIVLLSILNTGCGFFGAPWHCAATVRSVTHVSSVTIMSRTHAPGDKPHIVDVKEQRVSGLFVSVMIGMSVAMAPLLRLIPMAVLFGVFLYMGVASMLGVQFFERLRLFLMPVKYHPSEPFVRRVPTWKMHLFTFTQVAALAVLWAVKSSSFSLAFPFFLILMVPLRQKLGSYFTASELNALDGSKPEVDPENEPDFYEQAGMPQ